MVKAMENKKCAYEPCEREAKSLGLCVGHYQQKRRGKELAPLQEKKRKPNESYCMQCDTQKAREDFYLRPNGKLQNECRDCMRGRAKARRERAAEAIRRLEALEGV